MNKESKLQELCRDYLYKLRHIAKRHGLLTWVDNTINANKRGECVSTEDEVEMLARMVEDDRISRTDVPKLLGKSYRQCFDDNDFDNIKKFKHVGIYSKVSALLYKNKNDEN